MSEQKSWTVVFTDIELDDCKVLLLGKMLEATAGVAGVSIRAKTIETWKFKARHVIAADPAPLLPLIGRRTGTGTQLN